MLKLMKNKISAYTVSPMLTTPVLKYTPTAVINMSQQVRKKPAAKNFAAGWKL